MVNSMKVKGAQVPKGTYSTHRSPGYMPIGRGLFALVVLITCCGTPKDRTQLHVIHDTANGTVSVYEDGREAPLLVQHAKPGVRPYIHPIMAPDGNGMLTEYSPAHHKHQTGLYWGLKKVNGRDYFMNWKEDYWRRISADVITKAGEEVRWRTTYQLLDEAGDAVMTESQTWTFRKQGDRFILDLEWLGKGETDVIMEKFYVGGLFVRMPWREGIKGEVINSSGEKNKSAEGQRAMWNDIGIEIEGRSDLAHIAILDHPDNNGFPVAWRVDNELGVGPSRQILGDWRIANGASEKIRYRLVVYTGVFDANKIEAAWKEYAQK